MYVAAYSAHTIGSSLTTSCPLPHLGSRNGLMLGAQRKSADSHPTSLPWLYSPRVSSDTACPTAVHSDRFHVAPIEMTCGNAVGQPVDVYRSFVSFVSVASVAFVASIAVVASIVVVVVVVVIVWLNGRPHPEQMP